jgi:hypothetical protein
MAQPPALSIYHSPQNAGQAQILASDNTPLQLLKQQQALEREQRVKQAALQADKEKQANETISKLMEQNYGEAYQGDLPYLSERMKEVMATATQLQTEGKEWWNPVKDPEGYNKVLGTVNSAKHDFMASKQYLEERKEATKILNSPTATNIDKEAALARLGEMDAMTLADRRKAGPLSFDNIYDLNKLLASAAEGINPTETKEQVKGNDGYIYTDMKKGYTPEAIQSVAMRLIDTHGFKATAKREYDSMPEEEKEQYKNVEEYQEAKAMELASTLQDNKKENTIAPDAAYASKQRLAQQQANLTNKNNAKNEKYRNSVQNRFDLIHAMATGNSPDYQTLVGGKHGGFHIVGAKRTVNKNGKPVLVLTRSLGSTTGKFDENGEFIISQVKKDREDVFEIDLTSKGWQWQINGILNTKSKEKVDDEDLRAHAANGSRWGLGGKGHKKKDITAPSSDSEDEDALGVLGDDSVENDDLGIL